MRYDWSDAWLQQAAGWRAVKEGLALYSRGMVQNACWEGDECCGLVQGGKPHRVRVRRLNATTAETFCNCAENQRSGAMCGHAVAVIAAARDGLKEKPVEKAKVLPQAEIPVRALAVRFFPYWKQEWKKGRITFTVEAASRAVEESDQVLMRWLSERGITSKPLPWLVSLGTAEAQSWFDCLIGHDDTSAQNQTLVFSGSLPQIAVNSVRTEDGWRVRMEGEGGEFFGGAATSWWVKNEQLFQSSDRIERDFSFTLFTEKQANITHQEYFTLNQLRSSLVTGSEDPLTSWRVTAVEPTWLAVLDGSLRQLRLQVDKCYDWGGGQRSCRLQEHPGFLGQNGDECFHSRVGDEAAITKQLRQQGWEWQKETGQWSMSQEDEILSFFCEGRGALESETFVLEESKSLKALRKNLVVIQPLLETTESNSRELSVQMSFRGSDGARFDSERIARFMAGGKRLIQTSDGKSLILPKESWELFQQTATDLQWKQEKGAFLAKNTQSILIDYLRKYIDKSNQKNDYAISTVVEFPLLQAELRDYQKLGAQWLHERLEDHGFALLADEMGLGKTLQTIAAITLRATPEHPALVVVPTSLLYNWEAEILRFAPSLKTIVLHGAQRESMHAVSDAHVIVTSYGVLMNDRALFLKREFSLMVLDEASAIRNPDTDVARCCYRMNARCRLALTGTPLENGLQDLWSIFHYLQPGYLGERQPFRDRYERSTPETVSLQSLRLRVMPFLLRRTKSEVVKDLPAKVETDEWCEMSPDQAVLYQKVWEQGAENIEKLIKAKDTSAHMSLLTLLLRLRQICCDGGLFAPELRDEWSLEQRSSKMKRLFDLIDGSLSSGRKMLVFSQFATQLRNIESECQQRGIRTLRLDGATRHRQEMVDQFQSDAGPPVFLISLKAGGYGLNLTAASTVVHFDPWWNPAAEQQASDRAHRIGQSQSVNVYRLLTRGTVEERVKLLQTNKARLADQMFGTDPGLATAAMPSMDELSEILHASSFHNRLS